MKNQFTPISRFFERKTGLTLTVTALSALPLKSQASEGILASLIPVEMSMTAYLIIGSMLVFTTIMYFMFKQRFSIAQKQLVDVATELATTRQRLTETSQKMEKSQKDLTKTTDRYQDMLYTADIGMFQLNTAGKCIFINSALQTMTGLSAKKVEENGLRSAIHPDDRNAFKKAWDEFEDSNGPLILSFRFQRKRDDVVYVDCHVNKVKNRDGKLESYVGWITDITSFQEEALTYRAETGHFERFIDTTIEGYYKLAPAEPIRLSNSPEKMAEKIMEKMVLTDCSESFAAMYGNQSDELLGLAINELKDCCGPFRDYGSIQSFVESGYKTIALETTRQDANGNRINLLNSLVGIVEDNQLVGIWGSHRNISQQKREKAELQSKVNMLNRILGALPADLQVKDTRCRYLYASTKMAARTGIPQEEWIGKTIFEIMPATPKDHDQSAIETMKSGKLSRKERHFNARGKSGWMETLQIPLISNEGLVEGVVAMSLDITDRKKKEEQLRHYSTQIEQQLEHVKGELTQSQTDYAKSATTLAETLQGLKLAEAESVNRENEFTKQLNEHRRTEETLRRNEQALVTRQKQLEEQLCSRLEELETETNQRHKWEELLSIKEGELRKLEEHADELNKHFEQETALRKQVEANLETSRTSLEESRKELDELISNREQETATLNTAHSEKFETEKSARTRAEKQLARIENLYRKTQEQMKKQAEQHTHELEKEVAERKSAADRLMQTMEELDALRQDFNGRIETETKSVKQELAKKQIREKALREQSKQLEKQIHDLEQTLHSKSQEFHDQLQAREGAEVEKHQIEQKMEQLSKKQEQLVSRATQRLNLEIAEIKLADVKIRKEAGDLQQEKEALEKALQANNEELENARQEIQKTEAALSETQASLKQMANDQSKRIAEETKELRTQLAEMQKSGNDLRQKIENLQDEKKAVEDTLQTRTEDLQKAAREYRRAVDAYRASQTKIKGLTEEQETLIQQKTAELSGELNALRTSEKRLQAQEQELQQRIAAQQEDISKLHDAVRAETNQRKTAEASLQETESQLKMSQENADAVLVQKTTDLSEQLEQYKRNEEVLNQQIQEAQAKAEKRSNDLDILKQNQKETSEELRKTERRLAGIQEEHEAELKKSLEEVQEISSLNADLITDLSNAVDQSLSPIVKTTVAMEQADNLLREQKKELRTVNHNCQRLIDMMTYRRELTSLVDPSRKPQIASFDLHRLLTDIDQKFGPRASEKDLFFAVSFAQYQANSNVPKLVKTDGPMVRKALTILLGYALERTKKGRVGLHATRKSSEGTTLNIDFELAFTGGNQDDPLLSSVFANDGTTIDTEFGLTLAEKYVRLLGGSIMIEHRKGDITALMVELPFTKDESLSADTTSNNKDGEEPHAGAA